MIEIRVETTSMRVVDRMARYGIKVSHVEVSNDELVFSVPRSSIMRVRELLDGYVYTVIDESLPHRISAFIRTRLGLIVGTLLSIIAIVILSNMTLGISIECENNETCSIIKNTLSDQKIDRFTMKISDTKMLEDTLMKSCKKASYISCKYVGSMLIVSVRDRLDTPPIVENTRDSIIANCDGIITRIIAVSGTPLVKVGDSVKKGDILIAPYVIYGEGEEERRREVVARGEIYARTYLSEDITLSEKNIVLEETGRSHREVALTSKVPRSPFKHYMMRRETHTIYGILPVRYRTYTYYELEPKVYGIEDKLFVQSAINNAYRRLDERLGEGEILLKKWFFQKRLDKIYIISVYYEVEKLISGGKLE